LIFNASLFNSARLFSLSLAAAGLLLTASSALAQSVQKPEQDNSPAGELASFEIADGYEVSLFADETDGIANPVSMRWDPKGRLWVLCTWAYPQLKPEEVPNDKLMILEDTNGDGRADKTSVFADGLNMPTGFALGDGGAYVGHGTELIHLADTDGDDKADKTRVLFTGFGTGDTHQNINSFAWSPGGELMFCQGLHTFSRVETPWGIKRGDEGGVWRLRPRRLHLQPFMMLNMCAVNPWGINHGRWGEMYVKSNDSPLWFTSPGMIETHRYHNTNRYGFVARVFARGMAVDIVENAHMPEDLQNNAIVAGYYAHLVSAVPLKEDGAGIAQVEPRLLIRSSHSAFRPVDIRIGPTGEIYIADWFNPIIGHYQASFRHPDRDKKHGRIWRLTAKDRPLVKTPEVAKLSPAELCEQLASKERWVRFQAKRRLADMPTTEALTAVTAWLESLDPGAADYDHNIYEAIGVFETHESINRPLLEKVLAAKDYHARAYAARVVGRWHDRLEDPLDLLAKCVADEHPRVRMEAVVALSQIPKAESMTLAARVMAMPMDRFIEYSLKQCSHKLSPHWLAPVGDGKLKFDTHEQLMYALRSTDGNNVAVQIRRIVQRGGIVSAENQELLLLLARIGKGEDFTQILLSAGEDAHVLRVLTAIVEDRRVASSDDVHATLGKLLDSKDASVRASAVRLAGLWRQASLSDRVIEFATNAKGDEQVRAAAMRSMAELSPAKAASLLRRFVDRKENERLRLAALAALAQADLSAAAEEVLTIAFPVEGDDGLGKVLPIVLERRGGTTALTAAIAKAKLSTDNAKLLSRWLSAGGYDAPALVAALKESMGIDVGEPLEYSADFVKQLAAEVRSAGDPLAGRKVFHSSLTNCTACHRISEDGRGAQTLPGAGEKFWVGPDLSAVGAGLPLELVIESVIWPQRQIKEGFEVTTLFLDDGRELVGYITHRAENTVSIRDLATGTERVVERSAIEDFSKRGTAMPAGFINVLTRQELRDLVRYLSERKSAKLD